VDVRVIAATNRDLQQLIEQGEFLEDLYYRLNVINIQLAPLRQRREDIDVLANIFLHKYSQEAKRPIGGIAEEALHCLREYDWPGNIRELENAIERAVVLGVDDEIGLDDLPDQVLAAGHAAEVSVKAGYHAALEECKRQLVRSALEQTAGNQTQAAEVLRLHRTYLSRLIKNLGLR
jgi:transcriptional regulator with PAS, ATPase and Fis domain